MIRRYFAVILTLLMISVAFAEDLPSVVIVKGEEEAAQEPGKVSATGVSSPEIGQWLGLAQNLISSDAEMLRNICTRVAITASELGYNDYTQMTYAEKAEAIVMALTGKYSAQGCAWYESSQASGDKIALPVTDGEFAVLGLVDGQWSALGTFAIEALEDEPAENVAAYMLVDVSSYDMGDAALILARHIDGEWSIAGVNKVFIDMMAEIAY